jgi:hypothetical protein
MPATKVFAGMARAYTPKLLSFLTHIGITIVIHACYEQKKRAVSSPLLHDREPPHDFLW